MPQTTNSPFRVRSGTSKAAPPKLELEPPLGRHMPMLSPVKRQALSPRRPLSPSKVRKSQQQNPQQPKFQQHNLQQHKPFKWPKIPNRVKQLKPHEIWYYCNIAFSLVMVLVGFTLVYDVFSIIRSEVRFRVENQASSILFEIEECRQNYFANKCLPGQRVPLATELCDQWELCMNRDPEKVLHLKLLAEALNETLRALLAPLSWNTLGFLTALFVGIPMIINWKMAGAPAEKVYVLR